MRVGSWRRLSNEEFMLLNCGIGEDSLKSLDCKGVKPVNPKGNQSWIFIGRTEEKTDSLEKTLMLGKIEGGRRRGLQDEMVGWHHWFNGHEFEQTLGVGDGQGGLACCSPWGHRESDTTERLNWTELNIWTLCPLPAHFNNQECFFQVAERGYGEQQNKVSRYACLSLGLSVLELIQYPACRDLNFVHSRQNDSSLQTPAASWISFLFSYILKAKDVS